MSTTRPLGSGTRMLKEVLIISLGMIAKREHAKIFTQASSEVSIMRMRDLLFSETVLPC